MNLRERLEIFFTRLLAAPAVRNADEALALICRLIEEVEAEFCDVPRRVPPPREPTGRMYAPQADAIHRVGAGFLRVRTAGHIIICGPDGSIRMENARNRQVEILKPGAK